MVRLEDGSVLSMGEARSGQCGVCGKNLKFKDEKINDVQSTVARHCGKIYTISQSTTSTVSAAPDPKFREKENKIAEKQMKVNKLRAQGKTDEAIKLEDEVQEDSQKLNEGNDEDETSSDEPKTAENPRAAQSREEEKFRLKR